MNMPSRTLRLGDLLAASQGSLDRDCHFFRLDHLGDPDRALLVLRASPQGQVHVYSECDVREHLQDLRADQVSKVFDHGRNAESFSRLLPSSGRETAGGTPSSLGPGEQNVSIQTAAEAELQNDPKVLEQVRNLFANPKSDTCPESWMRGTVTEVVHWPIADPVAGIRQVPFLIIVHSCSFGNFGLDQTTMPVNDPLFPDAPRKIRVCSTQFVFEGDRKVMLQQTLRFNPVSFSMGLGFSPSLPASGVVNTSPQKGDDIFENGKKKIDPTTGEAVKFDLASMQLHSKLKFQAWQRLRLDLGAGFLCREG